MRAILVFRVLGILLMLFSASLLPPIGISWIYHDGETRHLTASLFAVWACGAAFWLPYARRPMQLVSRDGFLIVTLFWVTIGLLGSIPFIFGLRMDLADAVFEAVSGFTTTGATVITGLDTLPPSLAFYRQELQWLGGIGIVVSAIALLPMLGVGGMQLYRAETAGPFKEEKLLPRITNTARALLWLYVAMTAACALLYWIAGMSAFDAIAHSLATVSTGGYSTHDASIAYFHSPAVEAVAIVFMLLGAVNFSVHFLVWRDVNPVHYWRNPEVRAFFLIVAVVTLLVALTLHVEGPRLDAGDSVRRALFEVVSVITSTGFGIDDFSLWPSLLPMLLILISFIGGCGGSTAGGMKVVRLLILFKQGALEIFRLAHPNAMRPLKLGGRVITARIVEAVWGYFALYVVTFAAITLALLAHGMDPVTAFGGVATCLNNLGPGLGQVAANFAQINDADKWLFTLAMLLGRLELLTLLVLLHPEYWKR